MHAGWSKNSCRSADRRLLVLDILCGHLGSPGRRAGADVARAEVARDGKIVLMLQKDDEPPSMSERNEWDEVNGED